MRRQVLIVPCAYCFEMPWFVDTPGEGHSIRCSGSKSNPHVGQIQFQGQAMTKSDTILAWNHQQKVIIGMQLDEEFA